MQVVYAQYTLCEIKNSDNERIDMGMFDWINIKLPCPKCGKEIEGFQSKDGECLLDCLEFWQVDNFHSYCNNCKAMVDYTLKRDTKKKIRESIENMRKALTIDDYELDFRDSEALANIIKRRLGEIDSKKDQDKL